MVIKVLKPGMSGDLNTARDFFGKQDVKISIKAGTDGASYTMRTYRGDDLIDLRNSKDIAVHDTFSGSGNDRILGGISKEQVTDQTGNDLYRLGGGADLILAGYGNDTYDGGSGVDTISFMFLTDAAGQSIRATQGVNVDLSLTGRQNLGKFGSDVLINIETVQGTAGHDTIRGNALDNALYGQIGNDLLFGGQGEDLLAGAEGNDTLVGGGGQDMMSLYQGGRDVVRYLAAGDSGTGSDAWDIISGFVSGEDKIDLGKIDARQGTTSNDAFIFIGNAEFSGAAGEIRVRQLGFERFVLMFNLDGDLAAEMEIEMQGSGGIVASDFIL